MKRFERGEKVFHRYAYYMIEMLLLRARRFIEFFVLRVLVSWVRPSFLPTALFSVVEHPPLTL